jgi:tRNASer (uridine44-2'-O)-methyltransferase
VLPCCPFSFKSKFQRRQAQLSVFRDYLNFVCEVGERAGFQVKEDRMRIPSTKRICFVGRPNTGTLESYAKRKQLMLAYLEAQAGVSTDNSSSAFKPRERVEQVRNCTQLDRTLISGIVAHVAELCLNAEEDRRRIALTDQRSWNAGGSVELSHVAIQLTRAGWDLSQLKSECGGLQTLLRNHHAVFLVRGGRVRLRVPGEDTGRRSAAAPPRRDGRTPAGTRLKTRSCWHYVNHPDGCPLDSENCTWLHVK